MLTNYETKVNELLESNPDIESVAIVNDKDKVLFSTENWDISEEIVKIKKCALCSFPSIKKRFSYAR